MPLEHEQPDPDAAVNVAFWNHAASVERYQVRVPYLYWYEEVLLGIALAAIRDRLGAPRLVHIVGCGPGREVPPIRAACPDARIAASDIAPAMVAACKRNLEAWGCATNVDVCCAPARSLRADRGRAELVTALSNVLTYVTPRAERVSMLSAIHALLHPGGALVGTVHHRWGQPAKSAYFLMQAAATAARLSDTEPGERLTSFEGATRHLHYFTRGELLALFAETGFEVKLLESLRTLSRQHGQSYPATGDNNLVYVALAR
ncbi:MAG: class I SAM-dependent methyltransferase [Gemmatimonadaceae bacterium]|nr:class I SAM-dependent methyltransferase [Gemmatimonadaceae bacterium]